MNLSHFSCKQTPQCSDDTYGHTAFHHRIKPTQTIFCQIFARKNEFQTELNPLLYSVCGGALDWLQARDLKQLIMKEFFCELNLMSKVKITPKITFYHFPNTRPVIILDWL